MLTVELPKLYAPVAEDFARYEERFSDALSTESDALRELVDHVSRFRGKQLRPALVFLAGRGCGCDRVSESHLAAAVAIELIHTATLVHDDVLDGADTRRSLPTANARWGNETSVLLGDFLFATAYGVAASTETTHTARTLAAATREVCRGEVTQLRNRGNVGLTRESYFDIIGAKTATLYAVAAELGATFAGATPSEVRALRQFGHQLGVAFQIADDILDLVGSEQTVGKSLGTDLEVGTVTLPILHAIETATPSDRTRIEALFADGSRQSRDELRALIEPYGSFEHARQVGHDLITSAKEGLAILPETSARDALGGIAEYVLERKF